jgi:thioredoxin reductase
MSGQGDATGEPRYDVVWPLGAVRRPNVRAGASHSGLAGKAPKRSGGPEHTVEFDDDALMARAVVIATGTSEGHLGLPGEDDLGDVVSRTAVIPLVGQRPNTEMVDTAVGRDGAGFLLTRDARTNVAGLFAAGDVAPPAFRTVAFAFADGVVAARVAPGYLAGR